jgi:hypothetical protein
LESQDFTWDGFAFQWYKGGSNGKGGSMFENTLRENIRNMSIGLGLSVVIIGAALAVAFA